MWKLSRLGTATLTKLVFSRNKLVLCSLTLALVNPASALGQQQQAKKEVLLLDTCEPVATETKRVSPAKATKSKKKNKFDPIRWKHDPSHLATKKDMIGDLLANYKLIGMSRKELYALLGHPEPGSSFHSYASYFIYYPMSHHPSSLQFAFSNDKVTKYRQTGGTSFFFPKKPGYSETDEWVDSPEEKALDDKATAEAKSKGLKQFSTVELSLSEDEQLMNAVKKNMIPPEDFPAALKASSRFLQLYPNDSNMWSTQGHLHSESKQYKKAIQDYSEVISLTVDQAATTGHENRARLYMKLRKYNDAIADYSVALKYLLSENSLHPMAGDFRAGRVYAGRGLAELNLGQTEKALDDLNKAISLLSIKRKEPYLWRARVYEAQEQPDLAKADKELADTLPAAGRLWSFDIDQ